MQRGVRAGCSSPRRQRRVGPVHGAPLHALICNGTADCPPCAPVQVDLRGAIQAGIPFCRAANGVVLSEGPIPLRFVRRAKASAGAAGWEVHMPTLRIRSVLSPARPLLTNPARSLSLSHSALQLRDLPEPWQREIPNRERLLREEAA